MFSADLEEIDKLDGSQVEKKYYNYSNISSKQFNQKILTICGIKICGIVFF